MNRNLFILYENINKKLFNCTTLYIHKLSTLPCTKMSGRAYLCPHVVLMYIALVYRFLGMVITQTKTGTLSFNISATAWLPTTFTKAIDINHHLCEITANYVTELFSSSLMNDVIISRKALAEYTEQPGLTWALVHYHHHHYEQSK